MESQPQQQYPAYYPNAAVMPDDNPVQNPGYQPQFQQYERQYQQQPQQQAQKVQQYDTKEISGSMET